MSGSSPRLTLPYIAVGQAQKEAAYVLAMDELDALVQGVVQGVGVNTPPGSPTNGQCWVVGASPTGDWAGQANRIAQRIGGGWRFYVQFTGMEFFNVADSRRYRWTGSAWAEAGGGALTLIERWTAAGGETSKSFTSLSGNDLIIEVEARTAAVGAIGRLYFNGDTTNGNYTAWVWSRFGANAVTGPQVWDSGGTAPTPTGQTNSASIHIMNRAGTVFRKHVTARTSVQDSLNIYSSLFDIWWLNTAAITQIDFVLSSSSFVAGSQIAVWARS